MLGPDGARGLVVDAPSKVALEAAIARALANDPPLIVADEPTGNLDAQTAELVLDQLGQLCRDGRTVLMVTHEREVSRRVDRVISLSDGRVVAVLDWLGLVVFAVSGALVASRKQMDIVGFVMLGTVTGMISSFQVIEKLKAPTPKVSDGP